MNEENMEGYLNTFADMMIPIGDLGTAVDTIRDTEDIRKMYKAGIKFKLSKNSNGEMIYKLITDEKNIPAIRNKLEALGLKNLTKKNISDMIRDGLTVVNKDGKKVNSKIVKQLESVTGFRSDFDDIAKAANISPSSVTKTINKIDKFGKVVTVGVNAYENTYNPMTGKNELTGDAILGTVTDSVVDLGMDASIMWASGAFFQGVIAVPGVGAAIGVGVGLIVSVVASNAELGEPPQSIYDVVKDSVKDVGNGIVDSIGKVFW